MHVAWMHQMLRPRNRKSCEPPDNARPSPTNVEKVQFLKDTGCKVIEIWTCDIERQLAVDPEIKEFFDNFEVSEPLEPRQAFFGGRTNATRLFYDAKQDEKIRYVDFCSLYPGRYLFYVFAL